MYKGGPGSRTPPSCANGILSSAPHGRSSRCPSIGTSFADTCSTILEPPTIRAPAGGSVEATPPAGTEGTGESRAHVGNPACEGEDSASALRGRTPSGDGERGAAA